MKKLILVVVAVMLLAIGTGAALAGNGAPSGEHYNLNIIGVPMDKTADMDNNNGHRIFVKLEGRSDIWLQEGDTFNVIDANGTDKNGAKFQLPAPDADGDGISEYSVYIRPLGKPGGKAKMTTCAIDETGTEYCSTENVVLIRTKGKQNFTNVTRELTTMYLDIDGDGDLERINIFDDTYEDYFWQYDNNGLKIAQLRFYPGVETNIQ